MHKLDLVIQAQKLMFLYQGYKNIALDIWFGVKLQHPVTLRVTSGHQCKPQKLFPAVPWIIVSPSVILLPSRTKSILCESRNPLSLITALLPWTSSTLSQEVPTNHLLCSLRNKWQRVRESNFFCCFILLLKLQISSC